jgi:hypothetical protein
MSPPIIWYPMLQSIKHTLTPSLKAYNYKERVFLQLDIGTFSDATTASLLVRLSIDKETPSEVPSDVRNLVTS